MTVTVGVDLGKTRCQIRVRSDGGREVVREGAGAPGLAAPGGVEAAISAVLSTLASGPLAGSVDRLAVGAAGAEADRDAAVRLAGALAAKLPAGQVAVTSDAVTAHLGALDGRPGVVLVAGTGAVALGLDADGRLHRADGWGPGLGDEGSGGWIGREAVRAVLGAHEQRAPGTSLTTAVEEHLGNLAGVVGRINADPQPGRLLGRLVPAVLRHAENGDAVARDIVQRAATALAGTTRAALAGCGDSVVAVLGGLREAPLLMQAWEAALPAGTSVVPPGGDALAGALTLATAEGLPHEVHTVRVTGALPAVEVPDPTQRAPRTDGIETRSVGTRVDVDTLATEQARSELLDLDLRTNAELVGLLLESEAAVADVVAAAGPALVAAVGMVADAFAAGGRLIYVGAGTPGRLAAVDAAECPPTFGTDPAQVVAVMAGGEAAAAAAIEGAEDDAAAGIRDLQARDVNRADVVVGITASGRTEYVLAALDAARRHGARTVAVVNNPGSPARDHAEVTIEVPTGPEVLAGSTRLRAGTAQKIVLNTLSTGAMIRAGKTYGPWMVDMVASNEKLRRRARRILREATGVEDAEALRVLKASRWSTKVALVSLLTGLDPARARARLEAVGGYVRAAVAASVVP